MVGAELLPEWSPDGTRVAFVSTRNERSHIYVTAVQGGRPRQLTKDPPLRRRVSNVVARRTPDRLRTGRRVRRGVPLHDECGRHRSALPARGGELCCPEWSPDGTRLAIALDSAIVVVDRNGKGRRLVTQAGSNSSPTWSPDGRWIAFESDRDDEDDADIFVVAATGDQRDS